MPFFERITENKKLRSWEGEIPVEYLYTLGQAGERFFREFKENARIMGTRCPVCKITYVPPRIYCERCFEDLDQWVEISDEGNVHAFTTLYIDRYGNRLSQPIIVALIKLRRSDGGIVHRIQGIDAKMVKIGMRVKAEWKPKEQRTGSIEDIKCFKAV